MQITLPAIAFGGSASANAILPAHDPWTRWLRAVSLGGQGFYAVAATELRRMEDSNCGPVLRSLAASTRAAHLRQGGRHHRAAVHDGAALYIVGQGDLGDPEVAAARCDALTGLAADNLGRGMFGAADLLLGRVEQILGDRDTVPAGDEVAWIWGQRLDLRWRWVRAELAMYTSDPAAAVEHAAAAQVIAVAGPSLRHRIKTELIGAAAAAASGDVQEAGERAGRVADAAETARQLPLQWAAAKLLDGIGVRRVGAGDNWAARAERLGCVLAERGGAMR
ncbi:hypothetical protein [Nocardia sp. 348MFTsu5.1]|uniref:hypothetical protein n=1 Tax=Nocardia sp. 348MFTsu5.1 TaxID=1172185 RepID=UPI00037184A0|nr:hypothetical protein [Nocardia sp. 348MFTsu5.1]